jgi:hypothetical protein
MMAPLPEGWEDTAVLGIPGPKRGVYLRLDPDMAAAIRPGSMPYFEPLFERGGRQNT